MAQITIILLQKKELAKFLDNIVNENYKEWRQIEIFANDKIAKNSAACADRNADLCQSYRVLTESTYFDSKLKIMVEQFDAALLEFIKQELNNDPLNVLESMATTMEGYLHLGSIIIEYME